MGRNTWPTRSGYEIRMLAAHRSKDFLEEDATVAEGGGAMAFKWCTRDGCEFEPNSKNTANPTKDARS